MPELPDVEGFRRFYDRHAAGKTVRALRGDASVMRNVTPQALGRALAGRRLGRARRHGKWLVCPANGPSLVLHFGMGGSLAWNPDAHPHDRLVLDLRPGVLVYRDMRKLGGIWLARDEAAVEALLGRLGPDWLDVDRDRFDKLLDRRRGALKALLMNQHAAAGLGNLTADESLWRARLDPRREVRSLDADERRRLYRAIRGVLRDSIPYGLVPGKRTWLTGNRERGLCPRCGAGLSRRRIGGRTTIFCPCEQS